MKRIRGPVAVWNAVRPAWLAALLAVLLFGLFGFTPQMIEVFRLEALSLSGGDPAAVLRLAPSWAALTGLGLVLFSTSLYALFQIYPFAPRALNSWRLRVWTAHLVAGLVPFGLLGLAFWSVRGWSEAITGTMGYGAIGLVLVCAVHLLGTRALEALILDKGEGGKGRVLAPSARIVVALIAFGLVIAGVIAALAPLRTAAVLGPIGVGALGFAVWGGLGTLAVVVVYRTGLPPLAFVLLAVVGLFSPFNDNHEIALRPVPPQAPERLAVADHLALWTAARLEAEPDRAEFAPLVVLAEGGGARAAYFTASVLAELHARSEGRTTRDTAVLSGVSGGSVGIASFVAGVAEEARDDCGALDAASLVRAQLGRDHLSPAMAGLLFNDVPQQLWPRPAFPDRAMAFERSLVFAWGCPEPGALFGQTLDVVARRAWGQAGGLPPPVVLFSATRTENGQLEVVSNARTRLVPNLTERLDGGLPLVSAAYLGARFPLIAPAGVVRTREGKRLRYVDGAYADNSSAVAAREAVAALSGIAEATRAAVAARCPEDAFSDLGLKPEVRARLAAALRGPRGSCRAVEIRPVVLNLTARSIVPPSGRVAGDRLARPFEDYVTPFSTLLAARRQRRWDALEGVCGLNAPEPRACLGLASERARTDTSDPVRELAARRAFFERTRWIHASLDHGPEALFFRVVADPSATDHVPLGWYLGAMTGYVEAKSVEEASTALGVLAP